MRYWTGGLFVFFVALVQASSVEQFSIFGVVPNLMLVFLVAWLVVRGLDDALPMIAVAGITLGLIGLQAPGLVLLALLPLAVFGVLREMHVIHINFVLALAIVAAGTVAYETIMLGSVVISGGGRDVLSGFGNDVGPAVIVNLALTPPVYFLMRFAKPVEHRSRLSY